MKYETVLAGIFLGLTLLTLPALGQDAAAAAATNASAIAEKQGVEEKFKQMAADIESLRTANQLLQDKLAALKEDLQQMRAEQTRLAAAGVSREDLKPLAQRIEEVDKKRQDDKDAISDEIKKSEARLLKLLSSSDPSVKPAVSSNSAGAPPATADGYIYTVKDGDRLLDILKAYNETFKSKGMKTVTYTKLKQANPDVDPNNLRVGQKIVIPRPAE
jgi:septal ring factor EnvC (AmiA/AmiB activator)